MSIVSCVKARCGQTIGEEIDGKLVLPGRPPLQSPASFGCEVCGTLQTWIAGQGTKLANQYTRPAGQVAPNPSTEVVR